MKCYGSFDFDNQQCLECEYKSYCEESTALNQPEGNNKRYSDKINSKRPVPASGGEMDYLLAAFIQESSRGGEPCPAMFYACILRLGGMSYGKIARLVGQSKPKVYRFFLQMQDEGLKRELMSREVVFPLANSEIKKIINAVSK